MPSRLYFAMSAEKRALLCCARVDLDAPTQAELATLAQAGLDFHVLVKDARRHGITPLLCRHLSAVAKDACPPDVLAELRGRVQSNTLTSFALAAELVAVLELFRSAAISAVAVKGPISAALCYGDLGLRTFSDLDILVSPHDVSRATALLEARGYSAQLALAPAWEAQLVHKETERLFRHSDGVRLVDLHWCLMPRGYSFTPSAQGVFARRDTVRVGATEVTTLGVEPTLLFLLLHGMKHDWSSLGWLCDVAELLRRHPTLDWDAVLAWSAPRGPRRFIDVGLLLVHTLLDAPVPSSVLKRGEGDRAVARLVKTSIERLIAPQESNRSLFDRSVNISYFDAMERGRDRLRFVHDVVFRPTQHEWREVPLPRALAPLHYLVRPVRLLWKHTRPRHRQKL